MSNLVKIKKLARALQAEINLFERREIERKTLTTKELVDIMDLKHYAGDLRMVLLRMKEVGTYEQNGI